MTSMYIAVISGDRLVNRHTAFTSLDLEVVISDCELNPPQPLRSDQNSGQHFVVRTTPNKSMKRDLKVFRIINTPTRSHQQHVHLYEGGSLHSRYT